MRCRILAFGLSAAVAVAVGGCRKIETEKLGPVRALQAQVRPRYRPPTDGLLTTSQIDAYLAVRRSAGRRPPSDAAEDAALDPAELAWVRARIAEALLALDAKQVSEAASEAYAAALSRLRETRRAAHDPKTAARLDAEIAALERERAAFRKPVPASPASKNAVLVATRRAELERVGP